MAYSSCFCLSQVSLKIHHPGQTLTRQHIVGKDERFSVSLKSSSTNLFGQPTKRMGAIIQSDWSFLRGSRISIQPKLARFIVYQKGSGVLASWMATSQIASSVFTIGTAAVLPFYTLMVLAPKSQLTLKSMESSIPYVVLGLLYAYLLFLSWTPDTLRLMFASKYGLPELPGIAKMFTSEMTLASAWIHLLSIDLFAARQVFHDGLKNEIETRHSVSLCMLFCPIGIATHFITKALTIKAGSSEHDI